MQLARREFERILIMKPSSFGDVIHALPVLHGLRERYPKARISWLVANSCAGLLEGHPALDEIIRFDRRRYGRLGRSLAASIEFIEFVKGLVDRRFDLIVDLQGLFRSGFMAMVTGARTRVGFANAREFGWVFYNHRVQVPDPEMHAVDRNYCFASALGFADVPIRFDLPVSEAAVHAVRAMLVEQGLPVGRGYLVVGPGTRWETKQWPAGHFAAAIDRVVERTRLAVVLVGMDVEREVAERVAAAARSSVVNLAGRTSLQQMIALISESLGVLMHDSGPMHLAVALGKPMVALYGPTSPARTGPYGRSDAVVRLDLPCSPCYLKRIADCPYQHRCMRELEPAAVADRLENVLTVMSQGGRDARPPRH